MQQCYILILTNYLSNLTYVGDIEEKERNYYDTDGISYGGQKDKEKETASTFRGLASSASQRRYHVAWSPCLPTVVSACSFDRKVQFYSLSGAKSKIGRAPKWLKKPTGATFGFGGKLISFDNSNVEGSNVDSKNGTFAFTLSYYFIHIIITFLFYC